MHIHSARPSCGLSSYPQLPLQSRKTVQPHTQGSKLHPFPLACPCTPPPFMVLNVGRQKPLTVDDYMILGTAWSARSIQVRSRTKKN